MNSKPPLQNLTYVALAAFSLLPAIGAPYPTAPPVPSLAPKAGMTTELFNGVKLAARPVNGAPVEGWYPLGLPGTPGDEANWPELAPTVFDAPAGVLRVVTPAETLFSGRARQIPASTEVSIDVFLGTDPESDKRLIALLGNSGEEEIFGQYGIFLINGLSPVGGESEEAEEDLESPWHVWVPGGEVELLLDGNLSNQWVRLTIRIDAEGDTVSYLVNGNVVYTGPISGFSGNTTPQVATRITEATLLFASGNTSEIEDEVIESLFFLDNFSYNGGGGAADLTVGKKRSSASHSGNNVYGSADNQIAAIEQHFNLRASLWFSLENDGVSTDEFSVRANRRGSSQVKVKTFAFDGSKRTNITGEIAAGSFKAVIEPGKNISLLSEAKLTGRARKILARQPGKFLSSSQALQATPAVNSAGGDSAKAIFEFSSLISRRVGSPRRPRGF